MRIVSLLPAATEIVCKLGFTQKLVGRSHECDFPEGLENVPVLTRSRISQEAATTEQINNNVDSIVQQGLSVYEVDAGLLNELQPDVIITQSQCEVCAVGFDDVERAAQQVTGKQPHIVNLAPNLLDDIYKDIYKTGDALQAHNAARELVAGMHNRIESIRNTITAHKAAHELPNVAGIEWLDPLMYAGNWMPTLFYMAGGKDVFGKAGAHAHTLSREDVLNKDPDCLLLMPCGMDIEQIRQELPLLSNQPEWQKLTAVQQKQVYITDGHQFFNRPGPRIKDSVEILAEILHPDLFRRQYEGTGWVLYNT